jgi:glutamate N-acetyltransferase/amino-acid N-acetyltransferase
MVAALPATRAALQGGTVVPAAKGICTTDLYPKVRSTVLPGGARIVGIAKGAGMVEPGLATMLVYILTDAVVSREELRGAVAAAVGPTFNSLSIDSDMSTSDTLVALASNTIPLQEEEKRGGRGAALQGFTSALTSLCALLSEDIVRNGEGVAHVIRVSLTHSPSLALARAVGKSLVNSPLFKCAVAGNDPNVGRLVAAIGKCVGGMREEERAGLVMEAVTLSMGGQQIFSKGVFNLNPQTEAALVGHLQEAQLWGECSGCAVPCRAVPCRAVCVQWGGH